METQTIVDALRALPFLAEVSDADLRAVAPMWSLVVLRPGARFWTQGAQVQDIAVLLGGELRASVNGVVVGQIRAGELLGEAGGFFRQGRRSATLTALQTCRALKLPSVHLQTLRRQRHPVYRALLDEALRTLARRIRQTNERISRMLPGNFAAPARRTKRTSFGRLLKRLIGHSGEPLPDLEPLLREQPGLENASPEVIATLKEAFEAWPMEEGEVICLEGQPGSSFYLVASGQVDVLRRVDESSESATLLACLLPGDQFGINTLIDGAPRTASCVASSTGWLYRMDADSFGALQGEARLVWLEAILLSLTSQVLNANARILKVLGGSSGGGWGAEQEPSEEEVQQLEDLLDAASYLESVQHQMYDSEVVRHYLRERRKGKRKKTS